MNIKIFRSFFKILPIVLLIFRLAEIHLALKNQQEKPIIYMQKFSHRV